MGFFPFAPSQRVTLLLRNPPIGGNVAPAGTCPSLAMPKWSCSTSISPMMSSSRRGSHKGTPPVNRLAINRMPSDRRERLFPGRCFRRPCLRSARSTLPWAETPLPPSSSRDRDPRSAEPGHGRQQPPVRHSPGCDEDRTRYPGSFTQRYVKRHGHAWKIPEISHLCGSCLPHLSLRFRDDFLGVECRPNPVASHRRSRIPRAG